MNETKEEDRPPRGAVVECPHCGSRSFEIRGTAWMRVHYDRSGNPGSISAPFDARWTEDCLAVCITCRFSDVLGAMKPADLRDRESGT